MSDLLRAALARMLEQSHLPSHQYGYPQPDQMLATPTGKALAALVAAAEAWEAIYAERFKPGYMEADYRADADATLGLWRNLAALRQAVKP